MSRRKPQSRRPQPRKRVSQPGTTEQRTPTSQGPVSKPAMTQRSTPSAERPASQRRRPVANAQMRRRQLWPLWPPSGAALGLITVVVVGAGVVLAFGLHGSGNPTSAPFGTPLGSPTATPTVLAPISTTVTGQPIDGIQCAGAEQLVFHIHAHLAVYVGGSARTVPEGIGIMPPRQETQNAAGLPTVISGSCYYWLHSHTPDGIIHIESPVQRTFTLGNWFDIWGITLDSTQVGPASGTVIAYVDGQVYGGDIRSIPLDAHNLIQLDVNGNVAPAPFTFPGGL